MEHLRRAFLSKCACVWLILLALAVVFYTDEVTAMTSSECSYSYISDGYCDPVNNNAECDYDGGDCCECTCVDSNYSCGPFFFSCIDPSADCDNEDSDDDNTGSQCISLLSSNGMCDSTNNNAECGYDGGDCCECTCEDSFFFTCGDYWHGGYDCLDPECSKDNLAVIIGVTIGALVFVCIIIAAVCYCSRKKGGAHSAPTGAPAPNALQVERTVDPGELAKTSPTVTVVHVQPAHSKPPPPHETTTA